jgi:hypothetical protein
MASKTPAQPVFDVTTVDRYRSANCDERKHTNSHITKQAGLRCAGADTTEEQLTTVSRYWGLKDKAKCQCKFGHKTRESALACVGGLKKAAQPQAQAAARGQAPKPAAPKGDSAKLHSGAEGVIARA